MPLCFGLTDDGIQEYQIALCLLDLVLRFAVHCAPTLLPFSAVLLICLQHSHRAFHGLRLFHSGIPEATERMVILGTCISEP